MWINVCLANPLSVYILISPKAVPDAGITRQAIYFYRTSSLPLCSPVALSSIKGERSTLLQDLKIDISWIRYGCCGNPAREQMTAAQKMSSIKWDTIQIPAGNSIAALGLEIVYFCFLAWIFHSCLLSLLGSPPFFFLYLGSENPALCVPMPQLLIPPSKNTLAT